MRHNPVKSQLATGGYASGALIFEFFSPGLPQICKNAGAEFVLFDMEHTGLGFETLKTQFALCRGLGIVPMVRVPRGEYHFIARALDVGAMGIMVPMVGSAEEAAREAATGKAPAPARKTAAGSAKKPGVAAKKAKPAAAKKAKPAAAAKPAAPAAAAAPAAPAAKTTLSPAAAWPFPTGNKP